MYTAVCVAGFEDYAVIGLMGISQAWQGLLKRTHVGAADDADGDSATILIPSMCVFMVFCRNCSGLDDTETTVSKRTVRQWIYFYMIIVFSMTLEWL